jgi:hypothetical protein
MRCSACSRSSSELITGSQGHADNGRGVENFATGLLGCVTVVCSSPVAFRLSFHNLASPHSRFTKGEPWTRGGKGMRGTVIGGEG